MLDYWFLQSNTTRDNEADGGRERDGDKNDDRRDGDENTDKM